jgi:hypothetical protein
MEYKQNVYDYQFPCDDARTLYGYIISSGTRNPKRTVTDRVGVKGVIRARNEIARNVEKIRHWTVFLGDYHDAPDIEATWFIDPPYQYGGQWYEESNKYIDFTGLSSWCQSRKGQVIVCENTKANWMDFRPLIQMNGNRHVTTEAIWTNDETYLYQSLMF